MKGAALTMGFGRVAELSSEIVQASRELAGDRVAKALEVLEEHLSRVKVVPAG